MTTSFLFYDLETFGSDPRRTRIAQFAAIRTDADLREIDAPISVFVQPANDLLPSPIATLITGIAPQDALRDGMCEADAFALICEEMSRPESCTVGYNSLRFDDEFIRHGLFRNFFDPYEREWRGGNCRWDLLDVLRLAHALRPEGIEWPKREDGATSFKLEHLAAANGVRDGDAHEALSDVRALIGLARRLRQAQPRLWDYALKLRDKRFAATLLDTIAMTPVLHVSQRFPAARLCAAPVLPLARNPQVDSRVIVFDLTQDPHDLLTLEPDALADRLYTPTRDLPDGVERIALKEVHLNKCPALVAWPHLRPSDFDRLAIDPRQVDARAALIRARGPEMAEKVRRVFARHGDRTPSDVDASIYDAFIDKGDARLFPQVRTTAPHALRDAAFAFKDARLPELLFRYRARNWPDTIDAGEQARWDAYRNQRLRIDSGLSEYTFDSLRTELDELRMAHVDDARKLGLLDRVDAWARALDAGLTAP